MDNPNIVQIAVQLAATLTPAQRSMLLALYDEMKTLGATSEMLAPLFVAAVTGIPNKGDFEELKRRYEWDDKTASFPKYLSSGIINPMNNVTEYMRAHKHDV